MSVELLAEHTAQRFAKFFGHPPCWLAAAPGRVNLIGEHTDYNDGFVLPMAIDRCTVIAAEPNAARQITLHNNTTGETATINLRTRVGKGKPAWANYVRGVIAGFQQRKLKIAGFNAVIDSNVPIGGGLSSSAALEVATATLLEAVTGQKLDPIEKAVLCQRAEHEFAGVPCGIMDQFTSVLARENHLLLLDCRLRTAQLVPVNDPSVAILIINTNVRHKLVDGKYARRRAQCETAARFLGLDALRDANMDLLIKSRNGLAPVVFRRARHVITENERTLKAARAFIASDWAALGRLMYASHSSLRDDYEVSCAELDAVVEIAKAIGFKGGVIGCRMTGAGFGGCAVSLIRTAAAMEVTRRMSEAYEKKNGVQPALFSSRPAAGAKILQAPIAR
ncbi:MAG TPA: galactokinase [Verrucomicrobiae bacterium]|nr:galactokinase [Verrucomicrobiae bacterium]